MSDDPFTVNLLEETKEAIEDFGQEIDNIIFIGSQESGHECSWELFEVLANREYDSGFGGQEVAADLIIVFENGTKMFREEFQGSMFWAWSSPFVMPKESHPIDSLFDRNYTANLSDINKD